ncbi:MAG: glycoside hydrolase family 31 protein [Ignavibacteriales bacterium]|nr:MAG: glycoside hydrolase family 31 protein [Ignavibacteriales bacterium]
MLIPHNAPENFDWIINFKNWYLKGNIILLNCSTAYGWNAELLFKAVTDEIWKYSFFPPESGNEILKEFVQFESDDKIQLEVHETACGIEITGTKLKLVVCRDPFCIYFLDENGNEILRENILDIDGLGRPFVLPLGFTKKEKDINLTTQSFYLRPDEALFGLGEKFVPLNKVGQKIISWTMDAFGSTSERSHKNIPFLWSTKGYGLFVNSSSKITWELGTESCQSYTIKNESGILDVYIIYGPEPKNILYNYTLLTGRSPVPPKWSFGLWYSSGGTYRNQEAMEKLVNEIEENNLPADVIHIDPWWMQWREYCNFKWNREAFPEIEKFIADLNSKGLKVCLWEHPYISIESDLYKIGIEKDYFVKTPSGKPYIIDYGLSLAPRPDGIIRTATQQNSWNARVAIIDLTNPDAYNWYKDLHRAILRDGVSVFKTDFGEDIPEDSVFFNGQTGKTMHNLYPLIYNKAVSEVTNEEKGYGFVWSRSGTTGNQRYPVCWSADPAADFESLAGTIRGGLSIGMSGVSFWSNDIGGYRGIPSEELFIRWAQFGLFCSHSRMHGDSPREPMYFGEVALAYVRKYIILRYQLFPYIYSAAIEAGLTGMPVLRALPLIFPDDPNTYNKDLEFMFGPHFLVAPIYNKTNTRTVYFPKGKWIDFHNGEVVNGIANKNITMPLEDMPVYVREGAIIPMMELRKRIPEKFIDKLIITVYPSDDSNYTQYEDNLITKYSCSQDTSKIIFEISGQVKRNYELNIFSEVGIKSAGLHTSDTAQITGCKFSYRDKFINIKLKGITQAKITMMK